MHYLSLIKMDNNLVCYNHTIPYGGSAPACNSAANIATERKDSRVI